MRDHDLEFDTLWAAGLSWSETARRLGTYRHTVWRWKGGYARPNKQQLKLLPELAADLELAQPVRRLTARAAALRDRRVLKRKKGRIFE